MAGLVRVRRLTEQEGQKLQRIVRRGSTSTVRFRRAMMLLASAGGSTVPVIANLVQADEDTVRDVIHRFNEIGLACLDPQWAGGRPRLLSDDDEEFVIQTATTRPTKLGRPFTRWSIRKLAGHLRRNVARPIRIGREALRCLLARRGSVELADGCPALHCHGPEAVRRSTEHISMSELLVQCGEMTTGTAPLSAMRGPRWHCAISLWCGAVGRGFRRLPQRLPQRLDRTSVPRRRGLPARAEGFRG